jgi:hypothetical protein
MKAEGLANITPLADDIERERGNAPFTRFSRDPVTFVDIQNTPGFEGYADQGQHRQKVVFAWTADRKLRRCAGNSEQ